MGSNPPYTLKEIGMSWSNLFALLVICWAPLVFEGGRGNLPKKLQTGGWAARSLFFFYLFCALLGTATVIRIVLYGNPPRWIPTPMYPMLFEADVE